MRQYLDEIWKTWINKCAKFANGDPNSKACKDAKDKMLKEWSWVVVSADGTMQKVSVPQSVLDAIDYIWST